MNVALKNSLRFGVKNLNSLNELKFLRSSSAPIVAFNRGTGTTRNFSQVLLRKNASVILLKPQREIVYPLSVVIMRRFLSTHEITKNIVLVTEDKRKIEKDLQTLRLKQESDDKPLVVIFSWLNAKQKHLLKYSHLYLDQSFDVLIIKINPWQLLWPKTGAQVLAENIVKFLLNNDYYKQILIHGFSVGGYLFGECLVHMNKDLKKYEPLLNRFVGQIWDSAADITEIPIGVPKALFPNNEKLQAPLRNYMIYHLKTFHDAATQHYIRSSQMFHTNFMRAPALFITSKNDPVGAESSNRRVADTWISNGVNLTWKCFDNSNHVMHFMEHRKEYIKLVFNHLASINMIKYPEKIRAKL
ncbi:hypothetical protein PVAND_009091 [Polypedilum vanderplanki]|uniref:Uncharacterized protein n=1 Tax=Polypedilum vanderplanki TaxID=319348 RepID=A0A9J6CBU6_POLVA|nr:hypothetical protein PVAND_009091 [Polypedilum vanderplanki]